MDKETIQQKLNHVIRLRQQIAETQRQVNQDREGYLRVDALANQWAAQITWKHGLRLPLDELKRLHITLEGQNQQKVSDAVLQEMKNEDRRLQLEVQLAEERLSLLVQGEKNLVLLLDLVNGIVQRSEEDADNAHEIKSTRSKLEIMENDGGSLVRAFEELERLQTDLGQRQYQVNLLLEQVHLLTSDKRSETAEEWSKAATSDFPQLLAMIASYQQALLREHDDLKAKESQLRDQRDAQQKNLDEIQMRVAWLEAQAMNIEQKAKETPVEYKQWIDKMNGMNMIDLFEQAEGQPFKGGSQEHLEISQRLMQAKLEALYWYESIHHEDGKRV